MHEQALGARGLLLTAALIGLASTPLPAQVPSAFSTGPPAADQDKPEEKFPRVEWEVHPSLRLGRGTRIDFRARFQWDVRHSEAPFGDNDESDALDLARRRIGIEGEIFNVVDYEVERELESIDPWRDVYADYKQFDVVRVQVGKFKLPFSLDENTSATDLDFVYRSRAAELLAPGRDIGIMLHGRLAAGRLRYEGGMFRHDGRNARSADSDEVYGGRTLAGRLQASPFRSSKGRWRNLEVAVAVTSSDVPDGMPALRARTAFDQSVYRPNVFVRGNRTRFGLEGQWRPGPFSVKAEFIRLSQQRQGQSVEDSDLSPLVGQGWYVSGTWAVTGEQKVAGLNNPSRPLLRGGPGAVELAIRLESLRFGNGSGSTDLSAAPRADRVLGNRDRAFTLGVNWYLNRWVKLQLNGIRDAIKDPVQGPLPQRSSFWSSALRFQLTI